MATVFLVFYYNDCLSNIKFEYGLSGMKNYSLDQTIEKKNIMNTPEATLLAQSSWNFLKLSSQKGGVTHMSDSGPSWPSRLF